MPLRRKASIFFPVAAIAAAGVAVMSNDHLWVMSAAIFAGATFIAYLLTEIVPPVYRYFRRKDPCKVCFVITSFDRGIVDYAIQDDKEHLTQELIVPANHDVYVQILFKAKIAFMQHQLVAAFENPHDVVEAANDATLDDRPESFDCLSMDGANNVLLFCMVDYGVRIFLAEMFVADPLIGTEQADFMRDGFVHEGFECSGANVFDHAGYDIALALYGTNNRSFARANSASATAAAALILVLILRQSADESFVNLDHAAKLLNIFDQGDTDLVAHHPCGFVRAEAHVSHDLKGAHALLAGQHEVNDAIPITQRFVGILKDRARKVREAIAGRATGGALGTLPVPLAGRQIIDGGVATTRAADAFGPAAGDKVGFASIFIGEQPLELSSGELGDGLGLFSVGHDDSPSTVGGYCHA